MQLILLLFQLLVLGSVNSGVFNEDNENQDMIKQRMTYLSETVWNIKLGKIISEKTKCVESTLHWTF